MLPKSNRIVQAASIIILLFISTLKGVSQDSALVTETMYHKYEGNYKFPDGRFVTGSLMDEIEGHMVFLEPLNVSLGGIFKPVTETAFQSLPPDSIQIRFVLNSNGSVKGIWWDEENKDSVFAEKINPYTIESIQFTTGDLTLSGELRLPVTGGPNPVVINVHGSGKVTRHMGPWNTFFLHYGIGVLSYDKRGAGKSTGNFATAGYKDFASDVLAAIDFVKGHPKIDTSKIGLHGSSEGGWVSSIVASKSNDLAFMIIRAGSGVSGAETYIHEIKNELLDYDLTHKEYRLAIQFERKLQKMAAEVRSLDTVNFFINQKRDETWFMKAYEEWDGIGAKRWVKMKKTGPIDPVVYLRKVSDTPVLWFLAEKDENVPYELSKPRIKLALKEAGNKDFEIVSIPEANHAFFVPAKDGGIRYADGYWDKMVSWLNKHGIIN